MCLCVYVCGYENPLIWPERHHLKSGRIVSLYIYIRKQFFGASPLTSFHCVCVCVCVRSFVGNKTSTQHFLTHGKQVKYKLHGLYMRGENCLWPFFLPICCKSIQKFFQKFWNLTNPKRFLVTFWWITNKNCVRLIQISTVGC